jgi:hypothetical protein
MDKLNFELLDVDFNESLSETNQNNNQNNNKTLVKETEKYDKTTTETYRIKRLFKIDPLTDQEIPNHLIFEYPHRWDPYTGKRLDSDPIGPLCFNALTLYDYYFSNRFKGLWNPAEDNFQGYYGDLVGSGETIEIKSRGFNPEKYLYRLPIIDCYLSPDHNLAFITMGPQLSESDIVNIDFIVTKYHKNKGYLTPLKTLKDLYDNGICNDVDLNPNAVYWFTTKNKKTSKKEHLEKFNRINVDKLVNLRY